MATLQRVVEVDYHFEKGSGAARIKQDAKRIRVLAGSHNDLAIPASVAAADPTPSGWTQVVERVQNRSDVWA